MIDSSGSGSLATTCVRRWALGFVMALALALATFFPSVLGAADVEWVLTEADCDPGGPATEISCGAYGQFFIGRDDAPPGCTERWAGASDPRSYPPPMKMAKAPQMPFPPLPLSAPGLPAAPRLRGESRSSADQTEDTDEWWLAIIDFLGLHGKSTRWLAEELAGGGRAEIFFVDDPSLVQLLGAEIGDFHLLASLCRVVEELDVNGRPAPLVVNLSLGRGIAEGETVENGECDPGQLLCQLERVVEGLVERGARVVAAAGNHGESLLPGALPGVAAVGALDVTQLSATAATEASWETPPEFEALFPANGLCLRGGIAAPGGSSFASAIFAGWLAVARERLPELDPLNGMAWAPLWSDEFGCFVLGSGPIPVTRCNAGFDEIVDELSTAGANPCWGVEGDAITLTAGPIPQPQPQPHWPSFDQWVEVNHPTPESDPCVPCTGGGNHAIQGGTGDDVRINLSRTIPLPGHHLHEVYLRVGDDFFPLGLGASAGAIAAADVEFLLLPGWGALVDFSVAASLYWTLSESPAEDCSTGGGGDCYWSATQVIWDPE